MAFENFALRRRDNRRQLIQIADKNHLYAAEGPFFMRAVETKEFIDAIQQIGAHHRNFIDHDRGQFLVKGRSVLLPLFLSLDRRRRHIRFEMKKGVDRLAFHIDRRHAGRRQNHHFLLGGIAEIVEQR